MNARKFSMSPACRAFEALRILHRISYACTVSINTIEENQMKRFAFTLLFALAAASLFSCADNSNRPSNVAVNSTNVTNSPAKPVPSATLDELASGRQVYKDNCTICHKDNGTGGEVTIEGKKLNPDDLSSEKIKGFTDEKIIGYIMNGVVEDGMPAFKDKLSEGQMRDVVKYIRAEIQKMPATAAAPPKS